jgi:hypothetical protein
VIHVKLCRVPPPRVSHSRYCPQSSSPGRPKQCRGHRDLITISTWPKGRHKNLHFRCGDDLRESARGQCYSGSKTETWWKCQQRRTASSARRHTASNQHSDFPETESMSHLSEHRRGAVTDLLGTLLCMSKGDLRGPHPPRAAAASAPFCASNQLTFGLFCAVLAP